MSASRRAHIVPHLSQPVPASVPIVAAAMPPASPIADRRWVATVAVEGLMSAAVDLLERESQMAALAALLNSARSGHGRVALVHGEAGIGKTALIERFVQLHARDGARVLWGSCDPLSTPLALAPVLDVARLH